jgi:hypothetical protein
MKVFTLDLMGTPSRKSILGQAIFGPPHLSSVD